MNVIEPGHVYELENASKCTGQKQQLVFFKDTKYNEDSHCGTLSQEVLRALIDRTKFLDNQLPSDVNKEIIYHLRMAIALFEARHLFRYVENGESIEELPIIGDHLIPNKKERK